MPRGQPARSRRSSQPAGDRARGGDQNMVVKYMLKPNHDLFTSGLEKYSEHPGFKWTIHNGVGRAKSGFFYILKKFFWRG